MSEFGGALLFFIASIAIIYTVIFVTPYVACVTIPKMLLWLLNEIRWRRRPLVYACTHNAILGLTTARAYRRSQRTRWRRRDNRFNPAFPLDHLPSAEPTFLFTAHNCPKTGRNEDYRWLVENCRVEHGVFHVPGYYTAIESAPPLEEAAVAIYGRRRARKMLAERAELTKRMVEGWTELVKSERSR